MKKAILEGLIDERFGWPLIVGLRKEVESTEGLISEVQVGSRQEAISRGTEIISHVQQKLVYWGIDVSQMEPGHGPGHQIRDFVNAVRMVSMWDESDLSGPDAKHLFLGIVAGSLHDIGVALVPRYMENQRQLTKHAEVSSLLLGMCLKGANANEAEKKLLQYAVAAHTHYLKDRDVNGMTIAPYKDTYSDGTPIWFVWIPRWVDRLDLSGPMLVGRHFLTLVNAHKDWDGEKFIGQDMAGAMVPQLEDFDGHRTMLAHVKMYADSQTNDSPYGRNDRNAMVAMRDAQRFRLYNIIEPVLKGKKGKKSADEVIAQFESFLGINIEPTDLGKEVAAKVCAMFKALPDYPDNGWVRGFRVAMLEYDVWAEETIATFTDLVDKGMAVWEVPGLCPDLRDVILRK